jgi:hypothetical protein
LALTPYLIERFGGLNAADDPYEVGAGAATNCLNVDFDQSGSFRSRDGSGAIKSVTVTSADGFTAFETAAGTKQFIVGYTNGATKKYEAYSAAGGAVVASATPTSSAARISAARIGTPAAERLYIANGTDTLWRWTGAAFTQPAGLPVAWFLTLLPTSNRLVAMITAGNSTVQFSAAGDPETWPATNTLDLTPGDGDAITGGATWQNLTLVFKQRRFFVFGGEGIDGDGEPVFNYRTVEGFGALVPPVTGAEGVYFFDGRSIWLTDGGVPRRVSRKVDPVIANIRSAGSYNVDQTRLTSATLSYSAGRLYVGLYSNGSAFSLVFDPKVDAWTIYSSPLRYAADLRATSSDQISVYWLGNTGVVSTYAPGDITDEGVAFNWNYTSGHYDLGYPGRTKVIQESKVWGTQGPSSAGCTLRMVADATTDFGSTLTLPAAGGAWQQIDREGDLFQHFFEGTIGSVRVSRLTHYVSFVKPAGIE